MARPESTGRRPFEKLAFSIQEFCDLHGISRAHFYNLRKLGLGPREMDVHGRRTISCEAAADWRRGREAAAEAAAKAATGPEEGNRTLATASAHNPEIGSGLMRQNARTPAGDK